MTPEQTARNKIDFLLQQCGWIVQDFRSMNITAGPGIAVREFPLTTGDADYALYIDGKVAGVIEAKKEGFALTGVETQSDKYANGLPQSIPHHGLPLPFAYESTGTVTRFTNRLNPQPRSREVFAFHRPEELRRLLNLGQEKQLRTRLLDMPQLEHGKLWPVQIRAIGSLEKSLRENRPRSLIQMTMGSGKTFTAISFVYRLIKFAGASRVLFLVDRNNLGEQTENEFQLYNSPYNNLKFTEEYGVQRLTGNTISSSAKVVITTIQRLYSMLQGEEEFDAEREDESAWENPHPPVRSTAFRRIESSAPLPPKGGTTNENSSPLTSEALPVVYNPNIPIGSFDFIVIDECHRSIYNQWRQVLDYFDAFLIGLTATPTKQTLGFFNGNLVEEYGHQAAVADNVNVGFDVYSIETEISKNGFELKKQPGYFVPHRDRRTRKKVHKELDEDIQVTGNQLDRSVVSKPQIRLVIQTFRDRLFTEIFPGRQYVPKTLIFAKNDNHAEDIVKIVREEFGKGNDFCQKITSKSTGRKPDELLADFRNSFNPRIAVTVDMIATGTANDLLAAAFYPSPTNSSNIPTGKTAQADQIAEPEHELTPEQESQLQQLEQQRMRDALQPFHNAQVRDLLLRIDEQIIDETTPDRLLSAGVNAASQEKAQSLISDFRQFIEDNKDEIEAISILYSRPHAAGLRYSQVKELARRLSIRPFHIDESKPRTLLGLWQAFGTIAPDKVDNASGKHCNHIVDLVALVRHAIDPGAVLRPVGLEVEERFAEWLADQQQSGGEFTEEQMQWLVAIKDHFASSLMIEQDDFEYAPFNQFGGIGRAYELFGDRLAEIMEELKLRLPPIARTLLGLLPTDHPVSLFRLNHGQI